MCRKAIVGACSETLYLMGSAAAEKRMMLTEHMLLSTCQNKGDCHGILAPELVAIRLEPDLNMATTSKAKPTGLWGLGRDPA